jgi:hypothetical protein
MFGRDTTDRFIDVPLADAAQVIARCRERIALLDGIDRKLLPPDGRERLLYYRDFEEFTAEFFRVHSAFERAQNLLKKGKIDEGRAALNGADPVRVITQFVKASTHGRISRGEQALVVVLNLKWLPYIVSVRQALGMEPARFSFQPTQHEPLAQGAGRNTFWVDPQHMLWKVLGVKETGAPVETANEGDDSACRSGIRITAPLTLKFSRIMGDCLKPGRYHVELTLKGRPTRSEVVDVTAGIAEITIRPSEGPVVVCAAVVRQ